MLDRLVDIRPGEGKRLALALCSLLLVVASYTVVKTVRDALFLSRFGITELSLMSIGMAVLTGFVVSFYLRRTAGTPRFKLIAWTNVIVAVSLGIVWVGLGFEALAHILPWVLYIGSSIFGVFTVMQFWLLANDLFDAREAKRLFGFVGAGAIIGGITGGFTSNLLAGTLGTRNLLLVSASMLVLEALLVRWVWPLRRQEELRRASKRDAARAKGAVATVLGHPYLRLIAAALFCATIATTLLGWQILGIVKAAYVGRIDEMTAFLGSLSAYLSIASVAIQALITGAVLRRFGVRVGLMALPLSLLGGAGLIIGAAWISWLTLLSAATVARVAEGGMRFAIDKASMELMWMPVPPKLKERGKAFIDTVVDRAGTGTAGLIWLGLAALGWDSSGSIYKVSFVVAGVVVIWLLVLTRARRAYVNAFRDVLSQRRIDFDGLRPEMLDAEAQRMIERSLASEDVREVLFALNVLEDWPKELPNLSDCLAHEDASVRTQTLRLLRRRRDARYRQAAAACLGAADQQLQGEAVAYLHGTAPSDDDPLIDQLAADPLIDRATFNLIRLGTSRYAREAAEELRGTLEQAATDPKKRLVRLLGAIPTPEAAELLAVALSDSDRQVVVGAFESAGRAGAASLVPQLTDAMVHGRHRRVAAVALQRIGPPAVDSLQQVMGDGKAPPAAKRAAVRLLGAVGRADAAASLVRLAHEADFDLSRRALRALSRLHGRAKVPCDVVAVEAMIDRDLRLLHRELLFLRRGSWSHLRGADLPDDLLGRVLCERADDRVERIFLLLGLCHDAGDIRDAHRGVRSPHRSIRSNAIEFLDNLLPTETKARLLPVLDDADHKRFAESVEPFDGFVPERRRDMLERLLAHRDAMLQAVSAWTIGVENIVDLRPAVQALTKSPEPVRGVAHRAVVRLDATSWEEPTMGLTAIEKALKLRMVDVLEEASTEDLAAIAQIAEEIEATEGTAIYRVGDAPDALFVVVSGQVRLHREETEIGVLGKGEAFGSWALVDEAPRVASATVVEPAVLLRVDRDDFVELLADRVDIVQAMFRAMAARLRELAGVSDGQGPGKSA